MESNETVDNKLLLVTGAIGIAILFIIIARLLFTQILVQQPTGFIRARQSIFIASSSLTCYSDGAISSVPIL